MNIRDWRMQVIGAAVIIAIIVLLVVFIPGSPNGGTPTPTATPTGTPLTTPTPTPTPNSGEVLLQIPSHAYPCADISATVAIGDVAGLQYGDFDVTYDPDILEVTGVSDGEVGGVAVPAAGNWELLGSGEDEQGELRLSVDLVSQEAGVDGRGSLCVIRFHVPCSAAADEDTPLAFNDNELYDHNSDPLPLTWTGSLFTVKESPTPQPTSTPQATSTPKGTSTLKPTSTPTGDGYRVFFTESSYSVSGEGTDFYTTINITPIEVFFAGQFILEWDCTLFELNTGWTQNNGKGRAWNGTQWIDANDNSCNLIGENPQCSDPKQGRAAFLVAWDNYPDTHDFDGIDISAPPKGPAEGVFSVVAWRTLSGADFSTGSTEIRFMPTTMLVGFEDGDVYYYTRPVMWGNTSVTVK